VIAILLYVLAGLIGALALMALIGLFLRKDHLTTRTAELPRPPGALYAIIRDVERHPRWRPHLKRVELLPPVDGKRWFREHGRDGKITFVVDEDQPPDGDRPGRLVTRIADDKLPFGGRWIIEIAAAPGGARVTVTEEGVVKNPLFRFLSRTVYSLSATIETWLRALEREAVRGSSPDP
jgi:hypothetical protein